MEYQMRTQNESPYYLFLSSFHLDAMLKKSHSANVCRQLHLHSTAVAPWCLVKPMPVHKRPPRTPPAAAPHGGNTVTTSDSYSTRKAGSAQRL